MQPSRRSKIMADFRNRVASAKASDRPYGHDDIAAAMDVLAALCGWVNGLEGAATRAHLRGNVSAAFLLDATSKIANGHSIAHEIMADISMIGREIRSQHTKEGLERARVYGTKSGRPSGRPKIWGPEEQRKVKELAAIGKSTRQISAELDMPRRSVRRCLEN